MPYFCLGTTLSGSAIKPFDWYLTGTAGRRYKSLNQIQHFGENQVSRPGIEILFGIDDRGTAI